jgi:hypothetical protein
MRRPVVYPPPLTKLEARIKAADASLATAKNETTRTPVATAQCKAAFEALTAKMRDVKRRYFLTPLLADADYIALGHKPRDSTPTPSGTPTAQVTVETYLIGRHELGVKMIYVTESPSGSANKGYRIWYSVVAPGETPPATPDDLRKSFYTKRKKDVIEFEFGGSGKAACFAVQIENEEKRTLGTACFRSSVVNALRRRRLARALWSRRLFPDRCIIRLEWCA